MKAFKFKLQTLLKKREIDEKEILGELIRLKQTMHDEIEKLVELKKLMSQTFNGLREQKKGILSIDSILRYETYLGKLETDIKEQQRQVIEARVAVERKNKEYQKASRKRKVVEKYKERCFKKYNHELLQEEYNFQDEFAVLGYNLKSNAIIRKV